MRATIIVPLVFLSACTADPTIREVNKDASLLVDASVRNITNTQADTNSGLNKPTRIVCPEPAPDVAVQVANAISFAARGDIARSGLTAGVGANVAISSIREAMQLAERTAAIQALDKQRYDNCQAWANGAVTRATYAIQAARISNSLVDLRFGELVAGDFGRAGAGGKGDGESSSKQSGTTSSDRTTERSLELSRKAEESSRREAETASEVESKRTTDLELNDQLKEKNQQISAASDQVRSETDPSARANIDRELSKLRREKTDIEQKIKENRKELQVAERKLDELRKENERNILNLKADQSLEGSTKASQTATGVGGISNTIAQYQATALKDMLQGFHKDDSVIDNIITACTVAFSESRDTTDTLRSACQENGVLNITLDRAIKNRNSGINYSKQLALYQSLLEKMDSASKRIAETCSIAMAAAKTKEERETAFRICGATTTLPPYLSQYYLPNPPATN